MYLALLVVLTGSSASANSPVFRFCTFTLSFQTNVSGATWLWQHTQFNNILVCAVACIDDPDCRMFTFSNLTKICRRYTIAQTKHDLDNTTEDETILAINTCAGTVNIGNKCEQKNECSFQKSVCFTGFCLCEPGLYYNPNLNTCQRECFEYAEEMDVYETLTINNNNNKILRNLTLTICKQKCVQETSFRCLTFDYKDIDGHCCLSEYGYLDVDEGARHSNQHGWALGQRRCK